MQIVWSTLKQMIDNSSVNYGYVETNDFYDVYLIGGITYDALILKDGGSDQTDFEATYKSKAGVPTGNPALNITGNVTTVVKTGIGTLHGVIINDNNSGGTVTVYNNTAGSGTKIAKFQIGTPGGGLLSNNGFQTSIFLGPLMVKFDIGLTVVTAGSANNNITVIYK